MQLCLLVCQIPGSSDIVLGKPDKAVIYVILIKAGSTVHVSENIKASPSPAKYCFAQDSQCDFFAQDTNVFTTELLHRRCFAKKTMNLFHHQNPESVSMYTV